MSKYTDEELEAIKLTINMWAFLAENGTREKEDHPEFEDIYQYMCGDCPLCSEYYEDRGSCRECPLNLKGVTCFHEASKFDRWDLSDDSEVRGEIAQEIVDILKEATDA